MRKLDQQLQCVLDGDFDRAWELSEELKKETPNCNRAAFNRGWHLLRRGEFFEGYKSLNRGRLVKAFGNPHPGTHSTIWDGSPSKTVMLYLEGGLGDQIHGARFVKDITEAGSKAIISCSPALAPIFNQLEGVSAICQHEALCGVFHDAWLPSMSAPHHLNHTKAVGESYIPRTAEMIKGRIGVRWSGNPKFEHEQYRRFPVELLFNAVKGDVVSLQRDEGAELKPDWIKQGKLDTWLDTQNEIAKCERVITSCTSIAHLSGAMGVETYIIVPIMPYYLWAMPGMYTDHYDSVKLFRQTEVDNWEAPFQSIKFI